MDTEMDVPFGVGEQPVEKMTKFFTGEAEAKFVEQEQLTDVVAFAFSMKATYEEAKEKYDKAVDEIKKRLDADKMEGKKIIKDFDERKVILTKANGQAKIAWEKWARGIIGDREVEALLDAKENRVEHRFIEYGKDSVRCEIV